MITIKKNILDIFFSFMFCDILNFIHKLLNLLSKLFELLVLKTLAIYSRKIAYSSTATLYIHYLPIKNKTANTSNK